MGLPAVHSEEPDFPIGYADCVPLYRRASHTRFDLKYRLMLVIMEYIEKQNADEAQRGTASRWGDVA